MKRWLLALSVACVLPVLAAVRPAKKGAQLYGELFLKDVTACKLELAHLFTVGVGRHGAELKKHGGR